MQAELGGGRRDFRSFTRDMTKGGFPTIREFEKQQEKKTTKSGMSKYKRNTYGELETANTMHDILEEGAHNEAAALKKQQQQQAMQEAFQERNRQM